MKPIGVVITTFCAGILYGIIHDLITAHLCVEYFTVGHPRIIESESPILLALTWGIIATWWVALPMGIAIAAINYMGTRPSLTYGSILNYILKLLLFMLGIAFFAGMTGYLLSEAKIIHINPSFVQRIQSSKHNLFMAAAFAHTFSYLSGIIGTLIVCIKIHNRRKIAGKLTFNIDN